MFGGYSRVGERQNAALYAQRIKSQHGGCQNATQLPVAKSVTAPLTAQLPDKAASTAAGNPRPRTKAHCVANIQVYLHNMLPVSVDVESKRPRVARGPLQDFHA
jgi:hypothetical protein